MLTTQRNDTIIQCSERAKLCIIIEIDRCPMTAMTNMLKCNYIDTKSGNHQSTTSFQQCEHHGHMIHKQCKQLITHQETLPSISNID